jgi:hypothetical protein
VVSTTTIIVLVAAARTDVQAAGLAVAVSTPTTSWPDR